jgi:ribonuclease HI
MAGAMIATLVTDGSYCEVTRAAAWAAWARSERGHFIEGGVFPGDHGGINPVEMRAAFYGLRLAISRGIVMPGDHVLLQTDSQHAAHKLGPTYRSLRAKRRERRGLPPTAAHVFEAGSPRGLFLQLVRAANLSYDVVRSSDGVELGEVDHLARRKMIEERARRQGATPALAEVAGFEDAMVRARNAWIKLQPPSSAASLEALEEMAREIGP